MEQALYPYSTISGRPPLLFPGGRRLAVYVGLIIEHFRPDVGFAGSHASVPDPMQYGWRDYGPRVGIWRLIDLFDSLELRVSGIINSEVCDEYPEILSAGIERGWDWVAHGRTNSILYMNMSAEEERQQLTQAFTTFDACLPHRPRGWLGPGLAETWATPRLLAEQGVQYLLDWCCDDQPFWMNLPGMLSVPYGVDINDMNLHLLRCFSGPEYERIVLDQFEVLLAESSSIGRVMALPVHTFNVGQPHRFKYFARILKIIAEASEVWFCTSDELALHYASLHPAP